MKHLAANYEDVFHPKLMERQKGFNLEWISDAVRQVAKENTPNKGKLLYANTLSNKLARCCLLAYPCSYKIQPVFC